MPRKKKTGVLLILNLEGPSKSRKTETNKTVRHVLKLYFMPYNYWKRAGHELCPCRIDHMKGYTLSNITYFHIVEVLLVKKYGSAMYISSDAPHQVGKLDLYLIIGTFKSFFKWKYLG